jgi:hypothetical protein
VKRFFRADQVGSLLRPRLPVVTDGEFRRENWYEHFIGALVDDCTFVARRACRDRRARGRRLPVHPDRRSAPLVDHFLLEYDDERSGDFAPLRFVPDGNVITEDDQWAKLRLVVETARAVWPQEAPVTR